MRSLAQTKKMLKRLGGGWNPKYWIFAADGCLYLMKNDDEDKRVMNSRGGVDQDYIIARFKIDSDGGDW